MSKPLSQDKPLKKQRAPRGSRKISLQDALVMADTAQRKGHIALATMEQLRRAERVLLVAGHDMATSALCGEMDRRDEALKQLKSRVDIGA